MRKNRSKDEISLSQQSNFEDFIISLYTKSLEYKSFCRLLPQRINLKSSIITQWLFLFNICCLSIFRICLVPTPPTPSIVSKSRVILFMHHWGSVCSKTAFCFNKPLSLTFHLLQTTLRNIYCINMCTCTCNKIPMGSYPVQYLIGFC